MRTSFHHQPEAQHPNFLLSTSWQADYPIFRGKADIGSDCLPTRFMSTRPKPAAAPQHSQLAGRRCGSHRRRAVGFPKGN